MSHPAHSSLRQESPAEMMLLTLVWDKTASGTARSKTGQRLQSWSAPRFGMGLPLGQRGAKQRIDSSTQLCRSSLSQRQSHPIQKRGESVPPGPSFARNACPDDVSQESALAHTGIVTGGTNPRIAWLHFTRAWMMRMWPMYGNDMYSYHMPKFKYTDAGHYWHFK